jgi:hypothetical protein
VLTCRILAALFVSACSTATSNVHDASYEDAATQVDASSSNDAGASSEPDASPYDDAGTGHDAGTNADPATCGGGEHNPPCAPEKYCDFENGCGTAGTCKVRPFCEPGGGPSVCGCDGETHESCLAMIAGIGLAHQGACLAPEHQFACGEFTCDNDSYCLHRGDETSNPGFFCLPLPEPCRPTTICHCIDEPCGCDEACDCESVLGGPCGGAAECDVVGNHVRVECITQG